MRTWLLLVSALLGAACFGGSQCGAHCYDSGSLTLEPALGAPGSYVVQIGSLSRCEFQLPTRNVQCSSAPYAVPFAEMEGFAVRTLRWTGHPISDVHVRITRDGNEIVNERVRGRKSSYEMCGVRCEGGTAMLSIPAELGPTPRPPCTIDVVDGTYAVSGILRDSSCYPFPSTHELTLVKGQLQEPRPSCTTGAASFDVDACTLRVSAECRSDLAEFAWHLSVEDALGDGSVLVGSVEVSMRAPSFCNEWLPLRLERQ